MSTAQEPKRTYKPQDTGVIKGYVYDDYCEQEITLQEGQVIQPENGHMLLGFDKNKNPLYLDESHSEVILPVAPEQGL